MKTLFLIKLGEIQLKDGNRNEFIERLKRDLKRRLTGITNILETRQGRFYLSVDDADADKAAFVIARTPGVNGWAKAIRARKDIESIHRAALASMEAAMKLGGRNFKIESRRADKSYPLESYDISREVGGRILAEWPELKVDVKQPDTVIHVEIREHAYVYHDGESGIRGLPVGSGGRGLLLLSGGIDSPVAGYQMLSRGLALESLYFHAYPYTSKEAWEKVRDLAKVLATFAGGMTMHTMPFSETQLKIKKDAPADRSTLYLRACMMMAADMLARKRVLGSIVTGESLGQVASQTAENMRFTQSWTSYPVFRPLIGTDKEDTIRCARKIGSYEISILPYADCCMLFSPRHPIIKAMFDDERKAFQKLGLVEQVSAAVEATETLHLPFSFTPA
ncbi:MAG: tRNA uracil 4-sulfurtransferase ThiI [Spirochaetota bacterium]